MLFSFIDGPPQKGKGKKEKASKKSRGDEIPKASIGISQKKIGKKKRGRHKEFFPSSEDKNRTFFFWRVSEKMGPTFRIGGSSYVSRIVGSNNMAPPHSVNPLRKKK